MSTSAADRALQMIEQCVDPKSLRQIAVNARRQGMSDVARAADFASMKYYPPKNQAL
ncbi:hypothetical protein FB008_11232 [Sinorhizobium medicae]|uniref:hypothetical protein n=1 Tax=Sinorhizobium medicae TaxID=110321 RepID=UPI0011AD017C|nr:hypothetical protein [Sinorhizobium medicae]TWA50521.1 hypothetical protein FB008_11232 [Sinorhizobium medicae]